MDGTEHNKQKPVKKMNDSQLEKLLEEEYNEENIGELEVSWTSHHVIDCL